METFVKAGLWVILIFSLPVAGCLIASQEIKDDITKATFIVVPFGALFGLCAVILCGGWNFSVTVPIQRELVWSAPQGSTAPSGSRMVDPAGTLGPEPSLAEQIRDLAQGYRETLRIMDESLKFKDEAHKKVCALLYRVIEAAGSSEITVPKDWPKNGFMSFDEEDGATTVRISIQEFKTIELRAVEPSKDAGSTTK